MTSPATQTLFSSGSRPGESTPEAATRIITVGTQKIEVTPLSRRNSGSLDG